MKIVNIKKFIRGICLIFFLLTVISLIISKISFSYNIKTYKRIYVNSGDTLWSIASSLKDSEYYKRKDIRFIINDIKEINNLKTSNLSIGDELLIPTL